MICTFFGHRDCPDYIIKDLELMIVDLVEHKGVKTFLVGNNGKFDKMVLEVLKDCKSIHTQINYCVVIAYLSDNYSECPSVYPEGLELVPRRFAVSYRNKWMIEQSDYVIGYVERSFGGASKFFEFAKRKGKECINLCKTKGGAP